MTRSRKNRTPRNFQFETLETRQMMAADLYGPAPAEELVAAAVPSGRGYRPTPRPSAQPTTTPTADLRGW